MTVRVIIMVSWQPRKFNLVVTAPRDRLLDTFVGQCRLVHVEWWNTISVRMPLYL